jgi:protein ImuB
LFVPKGPDPEKLELTVARLAKLVGEGNVGAAEIMDTHRFENFRMSRFADIAEPTRCRGKSPDAVLRTENAASLERDRKSGGAPPHAKSTGFRVIRPPVPVKVELSEAQPAQVFFRGAKGEVTSVSGPWRCSDDWWQEDAWDHDEWDLAIDFSTISRERELRERRNDPFPARGVYRVFYDALRKGWFMRGFYD